mgnify:CR=1 FL=1
MWTASGAAFMPVCADAIMRNLLSSLDSDFMDSLLYAKLLGETAPITWKELQPFFARGALLRVAGDLDLVGVAVAMAENDRERVEGWVQRGDIGQVDDATARDFTARGPELWSVVVAPWVLVQKRAA